jgi:3',5'-cyclic AMP phosphodiesterase CpdA
MRKWALSLILICSIGWAAVHRGDYHDEPFRQAAREAEARGQADSKNAPVKVELPLVPKSVRFAVIGDSGTGKPAQYEVAEEMDLYHETVQFDFVIMLGDNIYGGHRPDDFRKKFELPYHSLLDAGVKFYAALGNHDDPNDERLYKPFNMGGQRYYTFKKGEVEFFALDSTYMDPKQLNWLEQNLQKSTAKWKIAYLHHPLYSNGRAHGPDLDLRNHLTPLFQQYGVNVVFSGHEHSYERLTPEQSIHYFILGNSGKLITHDFRSSARMEKGFDTDRSFMVVEIAGDNMYFQTISRTGQTIDSGSISRSSPSSSSARNYEAKTSDIKPILHPEVPDFIN